MAKQIDKRFFYESEASKFTVHLHSIRPVANNEEDSAAERNAIISSDDCYWDNFVLPPLTDRNQHSGLSEASFRFVSKR